MKNSFVTMLAAAAKEPAEITVVITGITLVFAVLVLLALLITLEGKFFVWLENKKSKPKNKPKANGGAAAPASANAGSAQLAVAAPVVEQGISGEVVAVIMAAISAMTSGKYTLRCISRASGKQGNWGSAGVSSNVEPF